MRHLVIGASGQIGESLINQLHNKKEETIGTYYKTALTGPGNPNGFLDEMLPGKIFKLDIKNANYVEKLIADINPDVIYLPAAETRVDYCEDYSEQTELINVGGVRNVVDAINNIKNKFSFRRNPFLIFYSSDYIFDGLNGPYSETDAPEPINVYGKQKLAAEKYIQDNLQRYLIIRTTGVFSPEKIGKNFVSRLISSLRNNDTVHVPEDEIGTPTYAPNLVFNTLKLINKLGSSLNNKYKILNVAGRKSITRYEFAIETAKVFQCDTSLIKRIKSNDLKRSAKRPLNCGLNVELAESLMGKRFMCYKDGLLELKKEIDKVYI